MRIMGVADGVIMPTIITAHIAKIIVNSIAFQGVAAGVIRTVPAGIRNPDISIPPHVHIDGNPEHVCPAEPHQHAVNLVSISYRGKN
jgi:hypothetical protein